MNIDSPEHNSKLSWKEISCSSWIKRDILILLKSRGVAMTRDVKKLKKSALLLQLQTLPLLLPDETLSGLTRKELRTESRLLGLIESGSPSELIDRIQSEYSKHDEQHSSGLSIPNIFFLWITS